MSDYTTEIRDRAAFCDRTGMNGTAHILREYADLLEAQPAEAANDVCESCGVELISSTCDKCGHEHAAPQPAPAEPARVSEHITTLQRLTVSPAT